MRWFKQVIIRLQHLKILTRLLLIFVIFFIIPSLALAAHNQHEYSNEAVQTTKRYSKLLVQNANYRLRAVMNDVEDRLQEAALDVTLTAELQRASRSGSQQAIAGSMVKRNLAQQVANPVVKAALMVTPTSQYSAAREGGRQVGVTIKDLQAFYRHPLYREPKMAHGYPVWRDATQETSRLMVDPDTGTGMIGCLSVGQAVYAEDGSQFLGVLIWCIYPDQLTAVLNEYSSPNRGNTYVVGDRGMVEGAKASLEAPPYPANRQAFNRLLSSDNQPVKRFATPAGSLLVSASAENLAGLRVVNLNYLDRVYAQVNRISQANFLLLVLLLLVGVVAFMLLTFSLVHPIRALMAGQQRVARGDFSTPVPTGGTDELNQLGTSFNRMQTDMKQLIDTVYVTKLHEKNLALSEQRAKLATLQMQISPHFMYNTLDIIRWQCLTETDGDSKAAEMIAHFATLLRMITNRSEKTEPVHAAVACATTYIEVMNYRYSLPVAVKVVVDPALEAQPVPTMLLQPLVENCIKHAFTDKGKPDKVITIEARTVDQWFELIVEDNGTPMTDDRYAKVCETLAQTDLNSTGIGLINVYQRLLLNYPDRSQMVVDRVPSGGTRITLRMQGQPAE